MFGIDKDKFEEICTVEGEGSKRCDASWFLTASDKILEWMGKPVVGKGLTDFASTYKNPSRAYLTDRRTKSARVNSMGKAETRALFAFYRHKKVVDHSSTDGEKSFQENTWDMAWMREQDFHSIAPNGSGKLVLLAAGSLEVIMVSLEDFSLLPSNCKLDGVGVAFGAFTAADVDKIKETKGIVYYGHHKPNQCNGFRKDLRSPSDPCRAS